MQVLWYIATTLHLFLCLVLISVILLQQGKGADMGATFGGGSTQTVFGSRGPASFFHYLTTGAAGLFMVTSLYLAMYPHAPGHETKFGAGAATPTVTATAEPEATPAMDDGMGTDESDGAPADDIEPPKPDPESE